MASGTTDDNVTDKVADHTAWFAIKTRSERRAEEYLAQLCQEVFIPRQETNVPGARKRIRSLIPHVLFVRTTLKNIMGLEREGREQPELTPPFWIYRYPKDNRIQQIPEKSIELLRLLSSNDTSECEVFNNAEFKENQHVEITGGQFKGYDGYVVRVKKNKHVVVKIEGVCMVLLPFIHPDLLLPVAESPK